MTRRRWLLVLGLGGLVVSAAHPAIGAPLDVEAAGYGGTASGGWACGPDARVKYGGGGGEVRVHSKATTDDPESGWSGALGGAVEDRAISYLDCGQECGSSPPPTVTSGGVVGAGAAKVGYDWRWFGVRGGVNAYEVWDARSDARPTLLALPSLIVRGGRVNGFHVEGGLGSYDVPTIMRPGLFLGAAYDFEPGWEIALHGGVHQTFDGSGGFRGALTLKLPVTDAVQIGAGLALSEGAQSNVEPEAQAGVTVHVW